MTDSVETSDTTPTLVRHEHATLVSDPGMPLLPKGSCRGVLVGRRHRSSSGFQLALTSAADRLHDTLACGTRFELGADAASTPSSTRRAFLRGGISRPHSGSLFRFAYHAWPQYARNGNAHVAQTRHVAHDPTTVPMICLRIPDLRCFAGRQGALGGNNQNQGGDQVRCVL